MLHGFPDRQVFGERLNQLVFPAQPVQTIEHLHGRARELELIDKALFAPGRHVFIFGDRGVGKSSLAAAAARQYQSSDAAYIDVGCGPDATLASVIANIALQALAESRLKSRKDSFKGEVSWRFLKVERSIEEVSRDLHSEVSTVLDAVEVLREVAALHSEKPVVVVDEFDRIEHEGTRHLFADLIKHLGDKKVNLKFIFTGVGGALDDLLGAHPSAIRQLATIELERLSWDGRWEIVLAAGRALGVAIPRDIYVRIAAVSDGFPYYVHLMTEKILWRAWEDPEPVSTITWEHFRGGLKDAIESINAELRRPYEQAVTQRTDDYEEVLWSTADGEYLQRFVDEMYRSYEHIMQQREGRERLAPDRYRARIRALKEARNGAILANELRKAGLYRYRETMLRGYVRMQAEAHGIQLVGDKDASVSRQQVHVPSSARRGYRGPQIPRGVSFSRKPTSLSARSRAERTGPAREDEPTDGSSGAHKDTPTDTDREPTSGTASKTSGGAK